MAAIQSESVDAALPHSATAEFGATKGDVALQDSVTVPSDTVYPSKGNTASAQNSMENGRSCEASACVSEIKPAGSVHATKSLQNGDSPGGSARASCVVIFLHGLGGSGEGWLDFLGITKTHLIFRLKYVCISLCTN